MAFSNLKAEMRRDGITQAEVASALGMSRDNFCLKVNERIPTTISEATDIKRRFFPELSIDYLFESNGESGAETAVEDE